MPSTQIAVATVMSCDNMRSGAAIPRGSDGTNPRGALEQRDVDGQGLRSPGRANPELLQQRERHEEFAEATNQIQ